MREEEVQQVVELHDQRVAAEAELSRALVPFSDNLPYSAERLAQEVMMLYRMGAVLKFEVGRRLIVMWERERGESVRTFEDFVNKFFPDVPIDRAYEDMRYARKAVNCPIFRAYSEGKGNWSKALALLEAATEEELQEFEEKGEILGISRDDLDRMSVRELKKCIRKLKGDKEKAVTEATADLRLKVADLEEQVEVLEAASKEPDLAEAQKLLRRADKLIHEGLQIIRKVNWAVVAKDWTARLDALQKLHLVERLVSNVEQEIFSYEEPEPNVAG